MSDHKKIRKKNSDRKSLNRNAKFGSTKISLAEGVVFIVIVFIIAYLILSFLN